MAAPGLGWDFEKLAGPMRRAAVGSCCPRCGVVMGIGRRNPAAATVDHVIPRRLGGSNHPSNLRVLCRRCNCTAGVRLGNALRRRGNRMASFVVRSGSW